MAHCRRVRRAGIDVDTSSRRFRWTGRRYGHRPEPAL